MTAHVNNDRLIDALRNWWRAKMKYAAVLNGPRAVSSDERLNVYAKFLEAETDLINACISTFGGNP